MQILLIILEKITCKVLLIMVTLAFCWQSFFFNMYITQYKKVLKHKETENKVYYNKYIDVRRKLNQLTGRN